jgi:hypothetical protein
MIGTDKACGLTLGGESTVGSGVDATNGWPHHAWVAKTPSAKSPGGTLELTLTTISMDTCINGLPVFPGVPILLNEGDVVKFGAKFPSCTGGVEFKMVSTAVSAAALLQHAHAAAFAAVKGAAAGPLSVLVDPIVSSGGFCSSSSTVGATATTVSDGPLSTTSAAGSSTASASAAALFFGSAFGQQHHHHPFSAGSALTPLAAAASLALPSQAAAATTDSFVAPLPAFNGTRPVNIAAPKAAAAAVAEVAAVPKAAMVTPASVHHQSFLDGREVAGVDGASPDSMAEEAFRKFSQFTSPGMLQAATSMAGMLATNQQQAVVVETGGKQSGFNIVMPRQ